MSGSYLPGQSKVNIDGPGIAQAKKEIFNDTAKHGWLLLGYQDKSGGIIVQAKGTGDISEMASLLKDDEVQYVLVRIPAEKDGNPTVRDISIHWTGPAVKPIERGKKKMHFDFVAHHLAPVHCTLQALNSKNFNEATVRAKSNAHSGSHVIE